MPTARASPTGTPPPAIAADPRSVGLHPAGSRQLAQAGRTTSVCCSDSALTTGGTCSGKSAAYFAS